MGNYVIRYTLYVVRCTLYVFTLYVFTLYVLREYATFLDKIVVMFAVLRSSIILLIGPDHHWSSTVETVIVFIPMKDFLLDKFGVQERLTSL
jgi:hypothetical protein